MGIHINYRLLIRNLLLFRHDAEDGFLLCLSVAVSNGVQGAHNHINRVLQFLSQQGYTQQGSSQP